MLFGIGWFSWLSTVCIICLYIASRFTADVTGACELYKILFDFTLAGLLLPICMYFLLEFNAKKEIELMTKISVSMDLFAGSYFFFSGFVF